MMSIRASSTVFSDSVTILRHSRTIGRMVKSPILKASELSALFPLLVWEGKEFTLKYHFPLAPIFKSSSIPHQIVLKCGRQVGKTTSLAAQIVLRSIAIDRFKNLVICPEFNQIRRFSILYVERLIKDSPMSLMMESCSDNVFYKTFPNGSQIHFSYGILGIDRVRGISSDCNTYDEAQDIDYSFLPVLRACLSASTWRLEQFCGTPKTMDNTLQRLWEDSSQAEWVVPCRCGYWNTPSLQLDLLKMIGKRGLICAKCGKPINAKKGHWQHMYPDRRHTSVGTTFRRSLCPRSPIRGHGIVSSRPKKGTNVPKRSS